MNDILDLSFSDTKEKSQQKGGKSILSVRKSNLFESATSAASAKEQNCSNETSLPIQSVPPLMSVEAPQHVHLTQLELARSPLKQHWTVTTSKSDDS